MKPNPFFLSKKDVLFFDIFIKNKKVYVIAPILKKTNITHQSIQILYNSNSLICEKNHIKHTYEATQIFIYDFPFTETNRLSYTIQVLFNGIQQSFTLEHIQSKKTHELCITTLFKNDFKLMNIFYDYYKKQGVQHFFMYYNGLVTDQIRSYFDKEDVTLIEWNFTYWNSNSKNSHHYAQMGQLHDAIYRFGKDFTEYMIFCDLDEYMHSPDNKLIDLVRCGTYGSFYFRNIWANTIDNEIPKEFPNKFLIQDEISKVKITREKCIHKIDSHNFIGVHGQLTKGYTSKKCLKSSKNCFLFHFHSWSNHKNCEPVNCLFEIDN